jgi:5-formyltetrahydrofolate cyclo-ligase
VALYAALGDEVATAPLFELCCAHGKGILMPRVAEPRLEFAPVASLGELRPGRYGVEEPPMERPAEPVAAEDLVLVPGVAFDRDGNRLGRGGGHYDRTFPPGQPSPQLFGVAYAFQVVAAVPHGPGDRRVDGIVTENGIHRVCSIEGGHER